MKFSEKWLREWVNPKIESIILSEQIINSGIEIESIEKFSPLFKGVVVGKIISCITHPTLNNLKIVKVDVGKKNLLNILCKASNCCNKMKVAVAMTGSVLANSIKINLKQFQNQKSEGMLCSFSELGLFDSNDNKIIEFPKTTPIGINVNDYFLLEDNLIKVNVTPNRPDGLSIIGIARNIAAINNINITPLKEKNNLVTIQNKFPIYVDSEKKDVNFFGRVIANVNIDVQTPFWMKKKLFMSDMLSENIIINIINYVLIEIGQPLNVLNADIIDTFIQIKKTNEKNILYLKKDLKIILNKNILVFSDKSKILFIPGNLNSHCLEINKNTKNIFLISYSVDQESLFNINKIIGPNNILNYHNYGIDFSLQKYAIEYATDLILKICSGNAGEITSYTNNACLKYRNKIQLYYKNIKKIAGFFIDSKILLNILLRLEYQIEDKKKYWNVTPPTWRFDILIEEDVIGDILRIYGYNNIPLTPLKESFNFYNQNDDYKKDDILNQSATLLINRGYHEVITYSFIDPILQNHIFSKNDKELFISNPISKDLSCMRISLWPGLLKTLLYNKNRKQDSVRLFEKGLCFSMDDHKTLGVNQTMFLAGIISGFNGKENWFSKRRKVDFYDLKGDLESILELMCGSSSYEIKNKKVLGLHPNQSAQIFLNDNIIGNFGKIDPSLERKLDIDHNTFLFELLIDKIFDLKVFKDFKFKEYSKFPSSRRDISILISENISYSDIIKVCKNCFSDKKVDINLFDIYSCKEFSSKKSLAISFTFQDSKKTLKENEINLMLDYCIRTLINTFQIVLRK
ncbi:phenylalanine--tRNA ligase subunit beta [Buchnera aphidicola (Aphis craccivora)]|uniref:Phenylalanine--tRNA ligase beta subunit n=1 Tax=Buchnera aphidicola (Aphis craccivora) TaxID=466616 RepID=A0A4D6XRB8_9GAMM|nr:phenylalanine--tRNA ligase subunit beta [Buchnera aphidicola]QCI16391.1 phenylalanine--tRNA ligase subunit beta [Buchnera aphidicola (Aphis craccivora)]QLL40532.1 phenylalanine--tRNA ligase subunit beta [Buchnera aphidicola (Aphis craccivore)]WAI17902.1 MAG: phenylalanine--tRNA ligase subunit beta [Buchnera aphidicola (Aphis craccivora)]